MPTVSTAIRGHRLQVTGDNPVNRRRHGASQIVKAELRASKVDILCAQPDALADCRISISD